MLAFETECRRKAVELSEKKDEAAIFSGWPAGTGRAILPILSSVRRF
jgi:hypothetical protein